MAIMTEATVPQQRQPRRRWRLFSVVVVAALVVMPVGQWVTHDRSLAGGGLKVAAPAKIGQTVYADAGVYAAGGDSQSFHIDVRSLKARVATNTAEAVISLSVCRLTQPQSRIGMAYGTGACSSVVPLRPGSLLIDSRKVQVLLRVTLRRPGVVRIEGVDASYRRGLRFGHQHLGIETVITSAS